MLPDPEQTEFGVKTALLDRMRGVFSRHPLVNQVIIYGSRAKGTYRTGSDIDCTIKGEGVSLSELMQIENELDDLLLPYKIDLSLLHKINDCDLLDHIARVGAILYQR